jgi:hypothetical protein
VKLSRTSTAPPGPVVHARRSLERAVKWLYANDACLKQPYGDNLAALIHEPSFRENLEPCLFPKILTIQKIGNLAVHSDKPISTTDSLHTLKELFHALYWLSLCRHRLKGIKDTQEALMLEDGARKIMSHLGNHRFNLDMAKLAAAKAALMTRLNRK